MADIKKQALTESPHTTFLNNGPITLQTASGKPIHGEYLVFIYAFKGEIFQQWQVVLLRNDGRVFYAWAYTSPISQYKNDVAIANAMLHSWMIY